MKKKLIRLLLLAPAILGVLLIALYALISSESGTQWIINIAVEQSGQDITLNEISGTLLSQVTIQQAHYQHCAADITINNLHLDWQPRQLLENTLTIEEITVDTIIINQKTDCAQPELDEKWVLPPSIDIPLDVDLQRLNIQEVKITDASQKPKIINQFVLNAKIHDRQLQVELENIDYTSLNMSSTLSANLQQPYRVHGNMKWRYVQAEQTFKGDLQIDGDRHTLQFMHQLTTPYQIDSELTVNQPLDELSFSSHHQWQSILVPINNEQSIHVNNGNFTIHGNLHTASYKLASLIDTPQATDIKLNANGTVNKNRILVNQLQLNHQQSSVSANGQIGINTLAVELDVAGKDINPGLFVEEYPGQLQLDTHIAYRQQADHKQINLDIHQLTGIVRGYSFKGSGKVSSDLDHVQLNNIVVSLGDNEISANGEISNAIDIRANIRARHIEQVIDPIKGDLAGTIEVKGSRDYPIINARITSEQLNYLDQLSVYNTHLTLETGGTSAQAVDAKVDVEKINIQKQTLTDSNITITGRLNQHTISSRLHHADGNLTLDAEGIFDQEKKQWKGLINQLWLTETSLGDWKNTEAIQVSANAEQQSIQALCLQQQSQSICLDANNDLQTGKKISAKVNAFRLKNLQSYLSGYAQIQGLVNLNAELEAKHANNWTGSVNLNTDQLSLIPMEGSEFNEEIHFDTAELSLQLNEQSKIKLALESNYGNATAEFDINSLLTIETATINQGNIQLSLPVLDFLNPYLPEVVLTNGQANASLQLSGPVKAARIKGNARIDALDFYLPELGTEYSDAEFTIDANNISNIQLTGLVNADQHQLHTKGWINVSNIAAPSYEFTIIGEDFPVINTLDIQAAITPNLTVKGDLQKLEINGDLHIPQLKIILKELPNSIDSVSSDEIILADDDQIVQQDELITQGKINITLGDDTSFVGYGLQTELQGGLNITLSEHQPVAGHGVLSMRNAHYQAVGQRLDINKGKLIFSGPVEQPSLDIEIQRTSEDVTVSMLITGQADNPQTRLISNPALSEANKLSYLLTGRSVNNLSSGEGSNLTAAALSLGLSQSSPILQEIGSKFGFDTLSVDAGDDGLQSTSLLLGKHLSPRLYITYAKDLFSALGAIQMNYRLTDHLSLEVESGTDQTVDLIYSISTD